MKHKRYVKGFLLVVITGMILVLWTEKAGLTSHAEEYEYDNLNRVVKVIYDDGSFVKYRYDKNGNLLQTIFVQSGENGSGELPEDDSGDREENGEDNAEDLYDDSGSPNNPEGNRPADREEEDRKTPETEEGDGNDVTEDFDNGSGEGDRHEEDPPDEYESNPGDKDGYGSDDNENDGRTPESGENMTGTENINEGDSANHPVSNGGDAGPQVIDEGVANVGHGQAEQKDPMKDEEAEQDEDTEKVQRTDTDEDKAPRGQKSEITQPVGEGKQSVEMSLYIKIIEFFQSSFFEGLLWFLKQFVLDFDTFLGIGMQYV